MYLTRCLETDSFGDFLFVMCDPFEKGARMSVKNNGWRRGGIKIVADRRLER